MERNVVGTFTATTFRGDVFDFIVYSDDTMSCPTLGIESFNLIHLKPRFVLRNQGKLNYTEYVYGAKDKYLKYINHIEVNPSEVLIEKYNIDPELFMYLNSKRMIRYSTDMAYLYDFVDKTGFDCNMLYYTKSPFKHAKKKARRKGTQILDKQRKGIYN